jgi:hypothetical protein
MLEWLQNPFVVIALAVGAMFFGYFFGLFEGRGQGYKRRQAEEAEKAETEVPEAIVERLPAASPTLPPDEPSMLNVSKDDAGQLHLRLDGQRIEAVNLNPEQRKRIIAVLTQIRPWLEAPSSAPHPAQMATAQPAPVRPATVSQARPVQAARPAPGPSAEEEPVAAPQSIVAQIDSILQAQLAGTPLGERGIRLQESPEGGVIVWVGLNKYQGVDDVPDDQIKAAIRAAINTWEAKYTPGI